MSHRNGGCLPLRLIPTQKPDRGVSITSVKISQHSSSEPNVFLVSLAMLEHSSDTPLRAEYTLISLFQGYLPTLQLDALLSFVKWQLVVPHVHAERGFGVYALGLKSTRKSAK